MKKKLIMLTLSVVMAAMLVGGCGKDVENTAEETSVEATETESVAIDNEEDAEQETQTAEGDIITDEEESDAVSIDAEESTVSSEDTKENDTTESLDTTEVTENAEGGNEMTGEYTAEIIAASIPNNNVKMTITTDGFSMCVSICDENVAIMMDLGVSVMEIYSVDQMTYLHGVYEGQDMWSKASGAENLTESYSEDTEEGMQASAIHDISATVKENKNGKEYDVVTANVDNEAEDGTITANQYSFYIDPQTLQTEYMIYEEEGMVYETKIETIASVELPEGAASAQEIGADEIAMQMLGLMFAGYEE